MIKENAIEKRRYPRLIFDTSVGYQQKGQTQLDYTLSKDISEGGLGITLDKFIAKDSEIMVEFSLKKYSAPIRTKTKLAWIQKFPYAPRYRAGLEFKDMQPQHRINLTRFLNREPLVSAVYT